MARSLILEELPCAELLAQAASHWQRTGRPWVTLAYAQSLDGSLADHAGRPLALSGAASLQLTHSLRANHQAILIGIGTLLADNPLLTVRLVPGDSPQPVVLDSRLRFPLESRLMGHPRKPWVMHGMQADPARQRLLESAGLQLSAFAEDTAGWLPLDMILEHLGKSGVHSLMVEGGAAVLSSFLQARLADCVVITLAPVWVGGLHLSSAQPQPFPRLTQAGSAWAEEDLVLWGRLA